MSRSPVWTSFAISFFALFTVPALAATFTVINTSDSGAGSFRQALLDANAAPGPDTIAFNIPGAGVHTITTPATDLPNITSPVLIDGYTQLGSAPNTNALNAGINAVLQIELAMTSGGDLHIAAGADGTTIRGLVINNRFDEISVVANNVTIAGNFIGTDASGTLGKRGTIGIVAQSTASNLTVGGPAAADRNLISGHIFYGVQLQAPSTTGHLIQGNYIGTDITGTLSLDTPTSLQQPLVDMGGVRVLDNLISGNSAGGVHTIGNVTLRGNLIGTKRDGTSALPNGYGVLLQGPGSTVGGSAAGQPNIIAFNTGIGVNVDYASSGNRISQNSIYSNGALGIDLTGTGVPLPNDAGDPDSNAGNVGQNYPVITSASVVAGTASVSGTINSNPSVSLHLEFFANAACDPSGNGEGQTFIGATDVSTDASGNASFGPLSFAGVPPGQAVITSTATSTTGDTSEFSQCLVAVGALPTLSINNVNANEGNAGTTPFVFTVTLSAASASTVTVNYATADGTATSGSDYAATSGTLTFNPGITTQTITVNVNGDTTVEPNEPFVVNLSVPTNATIATAQGTGTIVNDDVAPLPTLSINNVNANEGNAGTTPFVFTVTLSAASASTVTVNYATADGTATSGSDYAATSGTLTFNPGITTQTITVNVNGDTTVEPNEPFVVNLSAPTNATIATAQGTGTIVNDDAGTPAVASVIPTLEDWAMVALAILLAASAMHALRRRRR